ncbi:IucA/IucC family protein [Salipaludibacillus sp. HK11]|uniref:IucA/IucC family protein n=1 Tax=Salipaludibacillus sp. HK11 TaxID=3394320 RepID=UPI0039FD546E
MSRENNELRQKNDSGTTMKRSEQQLFQIESALQSTHFIDVRRRIFRQLIESMIFEGLIEPNETFLANEQVEYRIKGQDTAGNHIFYTCLGRRKISFGRIRLSRDFHVQRVEKGREEEAESLVIFLHEIVPFLSERAKKLPEFIEEIEQTLLKDTMAQYYRQQENRNKDGQGTRNMTDRTYEELEGDVLDGHPYHPCYKSRIGFDLLDNERYGPDFNPKFKLIWVAVEKECTISSLSKAINYPDFIKTELGIETFTRFVNKLEDRGKNSEDYLFIPISPWQWREHTVSTFFQQLQSGQMVLVGEGEDEYQPQQSVRTLSNQTSRRKSHVKIALNITNTSAKRIIGTHHVENASPVSDWLESIRLKDKYLHEDLELIFLKEILGVSFDYEILPTELQKRAYGTLGAIWRESLHSYLKKDERAIPYTAICHIDASGRPFIDPWIHEYGLYNWVRQVLEVSILPLIHLLYGHGIAMESHAQNMVLVHRNGIPVRLALRDLPGGIRYYTGGFVKQSLPTFSSINKNHGNHSLSMGTKKGVEVRDYLLDGFFHINLAEFAMFLEEQYGLEETIYWEIAGELIRAYQQRFPDFKDRFEMFDLFEETIEVGQLTIRRLCGEGTKRDHDVKNPLSKCYVDHPKDSEV